MRLIDADALKEYIGSVRAEFNFFDDDERARYEAHSKAIYLLDLYVNDAPSIDIVRCKECVYCNIQNTKYLYAICERHGIEFKPFEDDTRTHGCTWGERKESE